MDDPYSIQFKLNQIYLSLGILVYSKNTDKYIEKTELCALVILSLRYGFRLKLTMALIGEFIIYEVGGIY